MDAGDASTVRLVAHGLKSNGAEFGALALSERLQALEALGRAGRLDGAARAAGQIDLAYRTSRASCGRRWSACPDGPDARLRPAEPGAGPWATGRRRRVEREPQRTLHRGELRQQRLEAPPAHVDHAVAVRQAVALALLGEPVVRDGSRP